jgi:hypothetical protein
MMGNEGRVRERDRKREIWGEEESNTVEGENGVDHLRQWRGLISTIGLNQQHLRIS